MLHRQNTQSNMNVHQALVNTDKQFVLWWHAKCACTSLKCCVAQTVGKEVTWLNANQASAGWGCEGTLIHATMLRDPAYEYEYFKDFFNFTVVRNPFARIVSHFRQQIKAKPEFNTLQRFPVKWQKYKTFRDFIQLILRATDGQLEHHVATYSHAMKGVTLHQVLKIPIPDRELATLFRQLGTESSTLRLTNTTTYTGVSECCADWPLDRFVTTRLSPSWECYYDQKLIDLVAWRYREDLQTFFPELNEDNNYRVMPRGT